MKIARTNKAQHLNLKKATLKNLADAQLALVDGRGRNNETQSGGFACDYSFCQVNCG